MINLYEIEGIIELLKISYGLMGRNILEDWEKVLKKVPKDYYILENFEVFNKVEFNTLPKYKLSIDYKIVFEDGYRVEELGINLLYYITLRELEEYRKYIINNL